MAETFYVDGCTIHYRTRADVGLGPVRRGNVYALDAFLGVVCHHTVSVAPDYDRDGLTTGDVDDMDQFMRYLQTARKADLGPEVPYSFVEFEDPDPLVCWLYEGRGLGRSGAHTQKGRNHDRYGVAIEGNTSNDEPSPALIAGLKLVRSWTTATAKTTGHRDWHATECPGDGIYPKLHLVDEPIRRGGSGTMYMIALPNGKFRVYWGHRNYTDVDSPTHWAEVIRNGQATGVYASPYMNALMDDKRYVDEFDDLPGEIGPAQATVDVDVKAIAKAVAAELSARLKS